MKNNKRFGVGLSGGGYRAAAFHLGTLQKLHELELLDKVDVLSTISGGSITGAALCLRKDEFPEFEKRMVGQLSTKNVITYVLTSWRGILTIGLIIIFTSLSVMLSFTRFAPWSTLPIIVLLLLLLRFQFRIFPVSKIIERAYDKFFFDQAKLSDLCAAPELAIGSTNLQTSRPFTFSKRKIEDSTYAHYSPSVKFNGGDFPVARAVIASSCVPFGFTPVTIDPFFFQDYAAALAAKVNPQLVDGGVFDNQGVQKLTQNDSSYACDIVLVSDAGNKLPFEKAYNNTFTLLLRTVETFMLRIKNFQMAQNIYQVPNKRQVAYLSLGWDIGGSVSGFYDNLVGKKISTEVTTAHQFPEEWIKTPAQFKAEIITHMNKRCRFDELAKSQHDPATLKIIRNIGTNLTPIREDKIRNLMKHSALLTEVQLRLYCPSLFS
ncbi:patatin-like phospholipase family protein [Mucilaginibacter phyllosphaerae]